MTQGLSYDEEASRRLEAMYVTSDVVAQRRAVIEALGIGTGERILDVGAGPGFLLREMAEAAGTSGEVHGVDISESMVQMAQQRCSELPSVTVAVGDAHNLNFADGEFDVAVSTQVLEYVADPVAVLREMHRVLRLGGRMGILATDWASLVWHGPDQGLMERVLTSWRKHCADPHLPRTLGPKLVETGFAITGRSVIPLYNPESHEGTYSGGLIDLIVSFVSSQGDLSTEDLDTWATSLRELGNQREYFFSLNRYLFVSLKPS